MYIYIYIYIYIYRWRRDPAGRGHRLTASRRGRDKRGFHRRATFPYSFVRCWFKCASVATFCHTLSHVATSYPIFP